jgi:hypothetical protein
MMMLIKPIDIAGASKTGTLYDINVATITEILGFGPNIDDDPTKVVNSWAFEIDGRKFGIWDYKGSHHAGQFSTYGSPGVLSKLFPAHYV